MATPAKPIPIALFIVILIKAFRNFIEQKVKCSFTVYPTAEERAAYKQI